jgi:hypothetical protein
VDGDSGNSPAIVIAEAGNVAAVTRDPGPSAGARPRFLLHVRRSDCIAINFKKVQLRKASKVIERVLDQRERLYFSFCGSGFRYGLNLTIYLKAKIIAKTQSAAAVTKLELDVVPRASGPHLLCVF